MPSSQTVSAPSAAANATLGRRFFEEQDRLRGDLASDLCAAEYRALIGGGAPMDRAAHSAFGRAFYAAFPDIHHDIEDVFATEDRVAVRFVLRGTHNGDFYGILATQRRIEVAAHILMHVADGQVVTLKGVFDEAGMLRQLGVLPEG